MVSSPSNKTLSTAYFFRIQQRSMAQAQNADIRCCNGGTESRLVLKSCRSSQRVFRRYCFLFRQLGFTILSTPSNCLISDCQHYKQAISKGPRGLAFLEAAVSGKRQRYSISSETAASHRLQEQLSLANVLQVRIVLHHSCFNPYNERKTIS